jgi:ABC-type multidrug transport system fused ATPase/permease subunit
MSDAVVVAEKPVAGNGTAGADAPPTSRVFLRLLRLLRPQWPMIALGLFLLVLATPCELFPALVWRYVTDEVVLGQGQSPLLTHWFSFGGRVQTPAGMLFSSVVWLVVIYALGELFGTLCSWILNRVAQRFMLGFRNRVYRKLQGQSLSYLQRQRTGDLMSRAMGDVEELQSFIVGSVDVIIGETILWVGAVAIVMHANWQVATASLAPLVLVYVLLRVFNARIKPIYAAARERLGDVSTRLQENLSGVVVIKIFGREREEAARFEEASRRYYGEQIRGINARSLYFPFSRAVGFMSNVMMIGVGGYFLLADAGKPFPRFTLGDVVLFRAYWWRLFGPVQTLARVNDMVQRASAAGRRVFEVLDAPDELPDAPDARPLDTVRGAMELRNVTFSYGTDVAAGAAAGPSARDTAVPAVPDDATSGNGDLRAHADATHGRDAHVTGKASGQGVVLHGISIRIEPGQTVALCGPSGSGKSTILNLLLRFYDPVSGEVLLDGRPLPSVTRTSLRSHFALVQQETFLFNDSILDNIRYGHAEATMEQVTAAARAANAHEFIAALPNGYDTKVGERGVRLSGGQKQRISIARAFLANPQVLLLDEPTSSVEPDSEAAIIAALGRLMAGRTTVLTSHRPSLIRQADRVYVIEGGRVTEQGTPAELARGDGWFARFMRSAAQVHEFAAEELVRSAEADVGRLKAEGGSR